MSKIGRDLYRNLYDAPKKLKLNYTQILKTKCTIPSVMKKKIPKLAATKTTKNTLLHIYGETKKNLHTNEEKKRIRN
jgi:hypothetical protein